MLIACIWVHSSYSNYVFSISNIREEVLFNKAVYSWLKFVFHALAEKTLSELLAGCRIAIYKPASMWQWNGTTQVQDFLFLRPSLRVRWESVTKTELQSALLAFPQWMKYPCLKVVSWQGTRLFSEQSDSFVATEPYDYPVKLRVHLDLGKLNFLFYIIVLRSFNIGKLLNKKYSVELKF